MLNVKLYKNQLKQFKSEAIAQIPCVLNFIYVGINKYKLAVGSFSRDYYEKKYIIEYVREEKRSKETESECGVKKAATNSNASKINKPHKF